MPLGSPAGRYLSSAIDQLGNVDYGRGEVSIIGVGRKMAGESHDC